MRKINIMGLMKSNAAYRLSKATGWPRSWWQNVSMRRGIFCCSPVGFDLLINYGVQGGANAKYYEKYPEARNIPTINKRLMHLSNKYETCKYLRDEAVCPVPAVTRNEVMSDNWLLKPYYSGQGRGITLYDGGVVPHTHYLQKRIVNRTRELRITGALWAPMETWGIWLKKHEGGNDQICWNHDQGGKFVTVRKPENRIRYTTAMNYTQNILSALKLDFGAVDFVIDDTNEFWFLEINTRPGFTPLSLDIYIPMFKQLEDNNYEPAYY